MLNFFGMMDWSNMMNWFGSSGMMGSGWVTAGFLAGFLALGLVGFVVLVGIVIFWLWMLIDLMKRNTPDKAAWVFLLVFLTIIGAIIYYFLVYSKKRR